MHLTQLLATVCFSTASAWLEPSLSTSRNRPIVSRRFVDTRAAATPSVESTLLPFGARRDFLQLAGAAMVGVGAASPVVAMGRDTSEALTLERCIYLILRVQEGTLQEERLINTGKFRDLQRANIKAAATMLITNYQLNDCVTKASSQVVDKGKVVEATNAGRAAVDALTQINEYFDASDKSLQVNAVAPEKQAFVLKALKTARSELDVFLSYLPAALVASAKAQVQDENDLNKKEYKAPDGSSEYLNPPPSGASK